jgi:hypothetical protein
MMSVLRRRRPSIRRGRVLASRLLDGLSTIALHEADALNAHLLAAGERLRIAAQACNAAELLRDQLDLLPESRNRLRHDQEVRRMLWRGLIRDLRRRGPAG